MEIVNAFRGEAIDLPQGAARDLDALKRALHAAETIELTHMLLLAAPQGHQLKADALAAGEAAARVFLYDKSWTERQPEHQVDLDAEIFAGSSPAAIRSYIAKTRAETAAIAEATSVAVKYLRHQLRSVNKTLKRQQAFKTELEDDVQACAQWDRYWTATSQLPVIGPHLHELLDRDAIASSYAELNSVWARATRQLEVCARLSESFDRDCDSVSKTYPPAPSPDPETDLDDQFRVCTDAKSDAQTDLIDTLRRIGQIQLRVADELRKPLAAVASDLKAADGLKGRIAEVIDLPFLCGALLIELSRRDKWASDLEPLRRREAERERVWQQRYTQGAVGQVMSRLSTLCGLDIASSAVPNGGSSSGASSGASSGSGGASTGGASTGDKPAGAAADQVAAYLAALQSVGLSEVHDDLKSELGAMQRQFARSMSASISSLIPSVLGPKAAPTKDASPALPGAAASSTVAAYESRIKKLENVLMQTRLGSKTRELDVIRAETRAEARAEARAEVKAEQMQSRIAELEKVNHDLSSRLFSYTSGLETILNSMGLQTSRVDADTGEAAYRVNRVKGLSRRMSPPSASSDVASGASQVTNASAPEAAAAAAAAPPPPPLPPVDKLMDQTFVDNQVLFDAVTKRFGDVERLARKLQSENRSLKERYSRVERDCLQRVALHDFRPGDLILFLPTRDPRRQPNPWAAFNAGAPHYFLHPRHTEHMKGREYLIARAAEIEKRVVTSGADDENPFGLSSGVEWYLITVHGEWGV